MKIKKLNEVFKNWSSDGIFKYLATLDVPWKNDVNSTSLNIIYHGSVSGNKNIGALVNNYIENDVLSNDSKLSIASAIYAINIDNWKKLYKTISLDYNPIENYSMTENETVNNAKDNTLNRTSTDTNTNSENTVLNNTNNNSVYGFNSINAVNSDKQIGDTTQDISGNETISRTGKDTENETSETTRTLKRSGNIGVTTSQQMLESERNLWLWNFFYNTVFTDLDKVLTLKIY